MRSNSSIYKVYKMHLKYQCKVWNPTHVVLVCIYTHTPHRYYPNKYKKGSYRVGMQTA